MIDINMLYTLVSFDDNKTLLKTAEELHISQPALTVSMKKLEKELNVKIFIRDKNKLTLNDNGIYFVSIVKNFLREYEEMINKVILFDKSHQIIRVGMSAIAPNLYYLPKIEKTNNVNIVSTIEDEKTLIKKIKNKLLEFIFITNKIEMKNFVCKKIFSEKLYFYLPNTHPYANKKYIYFKEMNGESILMNREVGFWDEIVRRNMPNTNFILQDNLDNLRILVDNSNVAAFASSLTLSERVVKNRVPIEIKDKEANVDFYLVYNKNTEKKLINLFK